MSRSRIWIPMMLAVFCIQCLQVRSVYADPEDEQASGVAEKEEPNLLQRITSFLPKEPVAFDDSPSNFRTLASSIVRDNLPDQYVDDRKWGLKKEFYTGLSVRRDGFKIRTKRKKKLVNHGTWKRYEILQIDPDQNVEFELGEPKDNDAGNVEFTIQLGSKVKTLARVARWNRGIRVASVSMDADAKVRLTLLVELGVALDPTKIPPDVILKPHVKNANVELQQFRLNRISKIDGKVARELGRSMRKILEKKIAEKKHKLVAKVNKKIADNQDDLRFSVSDLVAKKWKALTD